MAAETRDRYVLRKDFRYLHEPIPDELSQSWVVGRQARAQELADRIMLSRGGAFLVSGLRGVGKTTCVRFAIHLIRANRERYKRLDGEAELVDVWLNLARPLRPVQLLHHLIRHLYLRLKEARLLERLDPELREDLRIAFVRTSFEISSRSLVGEERSRKSELGGKTPWLGLEVLGKLSSSYKQSRSDEEALKYLPYDEKAAEFEILSFSRRLLDGSERGVPGWRRWWKIIRRSGRSTPRIKVVFVLDELDKLELQNAATGKSPLDPVLQTLKSVFTGSGFSYVFIGGKEAEGRLLEDMSRGDSIYESIFAYDMYLPCLWDEQDEIVRRCFEPGKGNEFERSDTVALYLRYMGRGVARRVWREINRHVIWGDKEPALTVDLDRRRYMEVFAKVQEALDGEDMFKAIRGNADRTQLDRGRLCFYYTLDWVFSRGREPFSASQVADTVKALNLGGASEVGLSRRVADSVMSMLLSRAFVERADRDMTRLGQTVEDSIYRLAPWVLLAFQGASEKQWVTEKHVTGEMERSAQDYAKFGHYRVLEKLGEGGFALVYKVGDAQGRILAAKVLRAELVARSAKMVELFEREINVLRTIDHPGVVRFHDSGEEQGCPYVVMDLLEGPSLRQVLDTVKELAPGHACAIALELSKIFGYVHRRGLVRLDIKPSNVLLTRENGVKVIDFGIALFADGTGDDPVADASLIGTPVYMAPEQMATGQVDARVDTFALGVVLYEMLTGQVPRADSASPEGSAWTEPEPVSRLVKVPGELDSAVRRALAKDPAERFQTMEEFANALAHLAAPSLAEVIRELSEKSQVRVVSSRTRTILEFTSDDVGPPAEAAPRQPEDASLPPVDQSRNPRRCPAGHALDPQWVDCPYCRAERRSNGNSAQPPPLLNREPTPARDDSGGAAANLGQADADQSAADLVRLLYDGRASVEQAALSELARLDGNRYHLVFDLARQICLWAALDGHASKMALTREPLKMGRNVSGVQLPLLDSSVSRQHVAFFAAGDSIEVEDLSTANGTLLNGKRIRRTALSDGDILRVGTCEIMVHILRRDRTLIIEDDIASNGSDRTEV